MRSAVAARNRWPGVLVAAFAGVVLSGCAASTEPAPPDAPGAGSFPVRPSAVAVAALAPCTMFNPEQQAQLGLRRSTSREARVEGRPSPICTWLSESDLSYNTQTISLGAEIAAAEPAATVIEVNGFGAVRSSPNDPLTAGRPFCQVSVDAAPGQSIRVQVGASPSSGRSTEEMCRLATEATSMVMTTVVAHG